MRVPNGAKEHQSVALSAVACDGKEGWIRQFPGGAEKTRQDCEDALILLDMPYIFGVGLAAYPTSSLQAKQVKQYKDFLVNGGAVVFDIFSTKDDLVSIRFDLPFDSQVKIRRTIVLDAAKLTPTKSGEVFVGKDGEVSSYKESYSFIDKDGIYLPEKIFNLTMLNSNN